MAELREIAFRITIALRAGEPEPLRIDLWKQSPDTAAYLIRAVIDECCDAGIALARVRVDRYVAVALGRPPVEQDWSYRSISIEIGAALFQCVEFHHST